MNQPILVTGGTGAIGRRVLPLLREGGRDVRVLSRRSRTDADGIEHVIGDTLHGVGLDAAFNGTSTVLHLAGGPKGDDIAACRVVEAAQRADIGHLVLISVIGAGDVPIGYVRAKAAAERVVRESGVPFTIIRAAQLHGLLLPVVAKLSSMRLAPRGVRLEPVDGDAVATRLAELALGTPAGRVADIAGPEILTVADMLVQFNAERGQSRRMIALPIPGAPGRAYRDGANLATGSVDRTGMTWREFLADAVEPVAAVQRARGGS